MRFYAKRKKHSLRLFLKILKCGKLIFVFFTRHWIFNIIEIIFKGFVVDLVASCRLFASSGHKERVFIGDENQFIVGC